MLRWIVAQAVRNKSREMLHEATEETVRQARDGELPMMTLELEQLPTADVVILFALPIEAGPFVSEIQEARKYRWNGHKGWFGKLGERYVNVVIVGVGRQNVIQCAGTIIAAIGNETPVISAGFAGALHERLNRGDFLMPTAVTDGKERIQIASHLSEHTIRATPHLHAEPLLTVREVVSTKDERISLNEQTGAAACDMETFWIAQLIEPPQRLTSVRIISDGVDDDIPPEVPKLLGQQSWAGKVGAATGALFQRPSVAKDLWKLRDQASKAAKRLAHFVRGVVEQV